MGVLDCKGCAERREAMRLLAERFAAWMKNPGAPRLDFKQWIDEQTKDLNLPEK